MLTGLSLFWFDRTADLVGNHLVSAEPRDLPGGLRRRPPGPRDAREARRRRAGGMRRARLPLRLRVEAVRGGADAVCGVALPPGLVESDRLPEPIFTPTTKAAAGHDLPLTLDEARDLVGVGLAERLKELTLTHLRAGRRDRARARHHPGRHEVRVRLLRRGADPDRRGLHAGLVAVLARRRLRAGRAAAVVRQAVRPRLARRERVGPRAAGPGASGRGRRADGRPIP